MDVFVLDRQYRRQQVVDYYISFIWTERYSAKGDFEIIVASTQSTRTIFMVGQYISINESDRLMEILEVEDTVDEEGRKVLIVKGYSMEHILEDRTTIPAGAYIAPYWWRTTRPSANFARIMYKEVCYANPHIAHFNFTTIDIDETIPPGKIPEPVEDRQFEFKTTQLYSKIKEICDADKLGFSITIKDQKTMHSVARPLVFKVYTGYDRTTTQTVNAPVVFSPDLDNLQNTKSLVSTVDQKNLALVVCGDVALHVWPSDNFENVKGRDRHELLVYMDDDTDLTGAPLLAMMKQRGREALAQHEPKEAFDGEIDHYNSQYIYGRDYGLGDLVELRNIDGVTNQMMVTEQIFVSDSEGHRWYPTLTLYKFIQPGSWIGWNQNIQWGQLTDEEWQSMP